MIAVKLREAMEAYRRRTGRRMTYAQLSATTGLAQATLESIGGRPTYNTSLDTVDRLCAALGCNLSDLLERQAESRIGFGADDGASNES